MPDEIVPLQVWVFCRERMEGGNRVMGIFSLATGFKEKYLVASERQICGDRPASGARPHDDIIKLRIR